MTLFEECINALGNDLVILSNQMTEELFESMTKYFPIAPWGRINWENVVKKKPIFLASEISTYLNEKKNREIYILWDEASLPSIKTKLDAVLPVIDTVTLVSFDTWLYSPEEGYVVEFYHENEINIGWCKFPK